MCDIWMPTYTHTYILYTYKHTRIHTYMHTWIHTNIHGQHVCLHLLSYVLCLQKLAVSNCNVFVDGVLDHCSCLQRRPIASSTWKAGVHVEANLQINRPCLSLWSQLHIQPTLTVFLVPLRITNAPSAPHQACGVKLRCKFEDWREHKRPSSHRYLHNVCSRQPRHI